MTWRELLHYGEEMLCRAGVPDAKADAWYMLEYVCKMTRSEYLRNSNEPVLDRQEKDYKDLVKKRAGRIPLQHLLGKAWFYGREFLVNADVLIPRQETELLVEEALRFLRETKDFPMSDGGHYEQRTEDSFASAVGLFEQENEHHFAGDGDPSELVNEASPANGNDGLPGRGGGTVGTMRLPVLDLCTGSGCIGITLALQFPKASVTASDLSRQALLVAEKNAQMLDAPVHFVRSDLFNDLPEKFALIVSNPPYIASKEIDLLAPEVVLYDPRLALDGGEDGLAFYRRIIRQAPVHLIRGGGLLLEIGHDQGEAVSCLLRSSGFTQIRIYKDLAGLDRVVCARKFE